jgi:O-6-methylguanine DNA methyltransferase
MADLPFMDLLTPGQVAEVEKYLRTGRREFSAEAVETALGQPGTEFQKAVWREICAIPYGETRTYGEVARRIGKPNACRAVGTACGRNQLPVIIPCHRVVGSGGIGGYAFDIEVKRFLLDLEKNG